MLASILKLINGSDIDSLNRSDSYFYAGYYYLIKGSYSEAAMCLKSSYLIRYELNRRDDICAKCLWCRMHISTLEIIKTWRKFSLITFLLKGDFYGKSGMKLSADIQSLVALYTELHEYSTAISYGDTALSLIKGRPELNIPETEITCTNIGVCYSRLSDYSKAALYLEKAITMHNPASIDHNTNYINLLNNLASAYFLSWPKGKIRCIF